MIGMSLETNAGPIEVWLSQDNIEITCRVVFDDERVTELDIHSLSMRGAQREITGWLISQSYEPVGRWTKEDQHGYEYVRRFRRPVHERPLMPNLGEFTRF